MKPSILPTLPTLPTFRNARGSAFSLASAALVLLSTSPALAAGNLESRVQSLGNEIINMLSIVAVIVATTATILAGYKYMSGDQHAKEQAKGIAIGAFFCFAAAPIVQTLKSVLS